MNDDDYKPRTRAIALVRHLLRFGRVSTSQAARLTGASRRQALGDLKMIAEVFPLRPVGDNRDRTWILDPAEQRSHLIQVDRIALVLGRELVGFLRGTPLHETFDRLDDSGAEDLRARSIERLEQKICTQGEPARSYDDHGDVLWEVLDGLLRERTLDLVYRSRRGEREMLGIRPLTLVVYRRALYLMCLDAADRPLRLAVERIASAETGEPFPYPEDWDPRADLEPWFGIVSGGEIEPVELWFSAEVADLVRARTWHPTARLEERPDGSVHVHMRTGGPELERFVLEWGQRCRVIGPEGLKARVVGALREALEGYETWKTTTRD